MLQSAIAPAAPSASPAFFRDLTRLNSVPCGTAVVNSFAAAPVVINVPHSGWLARLFLTCTGTLTTGAGTPAGAWATYPPMPWSLARQLRVYTNTQSDIDRISGWGANMFARRYRRLALPDQQLATNYNSTNRAALLAAPAAGTPAASTAYAVAAAWELPIVTDDALFLGALLLQSDQVTISLEITPPVATDIHAVTGVTVTPALTYTLHAIFFDQPADLSVRPNTQYVHIFREENRGVNGVNAQQWILPSGNTYLRLFGMFENNAAAMTNANIQSLSLAYGQTVTPINEAYLTHVKINEAYLGDVMEDGSFHFDFSRGAGIPGLYEGRDFLNSSLNSDLTFGAVFPSTLSLVNPNLRLISEQLQAIGG